MAFHISTYVHPWISMILAIAFELVGTINAKLSDGLTTFRSTWLMYLAYALSVTFLAFALDKTSQTAYGGIDLGVAYATWSGLGTIVAALAGVCWYGETLSGVQYFGMVLTIVGLIIINAAPSFFNNENETTRVRLTEASGKAYYYQSLEI
jgi:small multidrug resistance pump